MPTKRAIIISICVVVLSPQCCWAWADYTGTLGAQKIGFALQSDNFEMKPQDHFDPVHYYYFKYLKNIQLKISRHVGTNIDFEEDDGDGTPAGYFKLHFDNYDPREPEDYNLKHQTDPIGIDILSGDWVSADGSRTYPVKLFLSDIVGGTGNGRCGLDQKAYQHVEARAKAFHEAFVRGDRVTLKKKFGYSMPPYRNVREEIAAGIPHDLFCNDTGFMLGRGEVWFDEKGNILR